MTTVPASNGKAASAPARFKIRPKGAAPAPGADAFEGRIWGVILDCDCWPNVDKATGAIKSYKYQFKVETLRGDAKVWVQWEDQPLNAEAIARMMEEKVEVAFDYWYFQLNEYGAPAWRGGPKVIYRGKLLPPK